MKLSPVLLLILTIATWLMLIVTWVIMYHWRRSQKQAIKYKDQTIEVLERIIQRHLDTIARHRDVWIELITTTRIVSQDGHPNRLVVEVDTTIWDDLHSAALLGDIPAGNNQESEPPTS